jgi:outer membrane protein assembly factor BamB
VVEFGTSASPVRVGDLLVLVRDQDSGSHLLALKVSDGTQVWRTERPEFRRSFATPLVWEHDGTRELVVPGSIWLKSYDPATGNENWTVSGTSRVATSSPAMGDGLLFTASWNVGGDPDDRISMEPFETTAQKYDQNKDGRFTTQELPEGPVRQRFSQMDLDKDGFVTGQEWETMRAMFAKAGNAVLAIRPGGKGEITSTHLAWKVTRSLPYVSSPLYYDGRVYTMKNGGLASCYEAKTGKPFYQDQRVGVGSDFYSSAIGVDGKIYITSQTGTVIVLKAGDTFEVLSRNTLGEEVFATPAIVDGNLVVRSARHLWSFQSRPDTR